MMGCTYADVVTRNLDFILWLDTCYQFMIENGRSGKFVGTEK